jgi:dephospho-CoA kinase
MVRDKMDREKALSKLKSQLSNQERLKLANVAFSSLWERSYTQKQVNKAWKLLLERTIEKY